ncbi:Putative Glycosyl hydrolase family 47 [[Torrubiella] hemipterigena]|uniref:alpha-1,2-Mannosidase n=1 Tax=[Torrubiella] hemipterigena TaxID=1531966 RepID=A0A0A1TC91_9HYPO|nr:Putative Glycosyl hydrolase family 47 [[Torrubiella] hemipterigena]
MLRDPFDIHRKNNFKTAASQAVHNIRIAATQVGTNALEMSFSMPKNIPNFKDPYRNLEDKAWNAVRTGKVGNLFDSEGLPMYKDKPYAYEPSRRYRPIWRRKRTWICTFFTFILCWMMGWLPWQHKLSAHTTSAWTWLGMSGEKEIVDWDHRREQVVEAFQLSWDSYERHGWGYDEYHPIAKTGKHMAPKGLGWIIIDSLDTLILMNQTSRLKHAREWISTSLTWEQNQDVNTFETTIRMLGGLLSAHYLSTEFPDLAPQTDDDPGKEGEDLYLEKAMDLASRLMSAFDSPSGIPYASVNLEQFKGIPSHADMGASSTAEATTLQLEFKYLAKLTGEKNFWDKAEKVMEIIDENNAQDGLVPIYIYATNGEFRGENIRLGSRGDSYYEYLIKQYLQTNKKEKVYETMWEEALQGMRKHLLTYTEPSGFTILGERPNGLDSALSPKMDHLVCFLPGTIALAATGGLTLEEARKRPTWSQQHEEDMKLARELTQTCWGMYKYMATGLAAEITYFKIGNPPASPDKGHPVPPRKLDGHANAAWRKDFEVHSNDVHNLQRPETVESLFYMWRITGDIQYREWGWEMFRSFMNHTAVEDKGGFTSLSDANQVPPLVKDNMESFWLAETLKYMYLLFSPDDLLPLDQIVLNTEAHPFPRFDMGPLFSTGWSRKPRDASGKIKEEFVKTEKVKVEE